MSHGSVTPPTNEFAGDPRIYESTRSTSTALHGRESAVSRPGKDEPSLPPITVRSEDVETESAAQANLRRSLCPTPVPLRLDEKPPRQVAYAASAERTPDSPSETTNAHRYRESIPPKRPPTFAETETPPQNHPHHHHHHHHHASIAKPHEFVNRDPQDSVKTAPAVPFALKARIKTYQWLLAAFLGALIALALATLHSHAQRPTSEHPASTLPAPANLPPR